ncbi:MAG TPA: tetratricopeptide repeat protein [Candidatus Baltobacteraceae bacterium]|nr:tetratricopeptide repeat protein [Candidatus Baltobacteraceae bacterium]
MIGKRVSSTCLLLAAAMAVVGCGKLTDTYKCRSNDPDTRIAGCTELIQNEWLTPEQLSVAYHNRATAYSAKRNYNRAIQDFNQAIHLSPKYAAAYNGRGIAHYDLGLAHGGSKDYDLAIQDYNEAIRLSPAYSSAHYNRGVAWNTRGMAQDKTENYDQAIGSYNQAIQAFTQTIRLNPNFASAWYGRGRAYDSRGDEGATADDYEHAIQDYNQAIRLSPREEVIYQSRAIAHNELANYDQAIQDLNEAIRLSPKDAIDYAFRGASWEHKGDEDRAIRDFDESIRLNPKDSYIYEARGEVWLLRSNLPAAAADFEKALSGASSPRMAVDAALMVHVAMERQGRDDARKLARVAAAADLSQWPGPLMKFAMRKMTAGALRGSASDPRNARRIWHVCSANYFIGEEALFHNQRSTALARLQAARDGCPQWDVDYLAALAEIKRLEAPRAPAN